MGSLSIWHWLLVAVVVMLAFGRGKISDLMGDVAKGINSFKKGLAEGEAEPSPPPAAPVTHTPQTAVHDEMQKPHSEADAHIKKNTI